MTWVPLHVHSQYSILNSSASIDALVAKAKEYELGSFALTDQGNLYGAVEFYKGCSAQGIKPIIGCELHLAPGSRLEKKKIPGMSYGYPLILIAKNQAGYRNLCKLSSQAHVEGFYYVPRVDRELLEEYSEGLICICGVLQSNLARFFLQEKMDAFSEQLEWYQGLFKDDFYLELQRHEMSAEHLKAEGIESEAWLHQNYLDYVSNQKRVNEHFVTLGIPYVATNGSHYISRDDWKAHEILMNIQSGEPREIWEKDSFGNPKVRVLNPKRQSYASHESYFKSPEEMEELFSDLPDAIANSKVIAEKCDVALDFTSKFYPVFTPPNLEEGQDRVKEAEKFLVNLCEQGIAKRYDEHKLAKVKEKYPDKDPMEVVKKRLAYELELIISKGMCDYLLIVYDFIAWAKGRKIPVGPGRGSGAGSIILYLIGVTDIEPLRFNLFFERFINPERISYPDIDVDICMERRAEVIEYTVEKYGIDKVAQIITFGTMKAKMAIKDVGRVLSVPLTKVNAIAKLVPEELNITIDRALEVDADLSALYQSDEEVREVIDIARKLEGSVRNTGIHAAGLIICGDPLTDHIPICRAKDSSVVATQYSMKPVEAVGMLKIDFLGLKTLTSIQKTVDAIEYSQGKVIDWVNLELDDQNTFSLMNEGKTQGIFQVESAGMQDLLRQLKIDKFEEIIAVGALYRPGPMEMIPSFIGRKHGREKIEIEHPLMKDILDETYGVIVYQEQVMQIASLLAGYSLGEGDVLRRAMGKKDREEMRKQRSKFSSGAVANGIEEGTALRIFDKVEKFASYGFNKSHAAAYGYLTYVTAYLKANYPREWMAALMTCDRDDLSKVSKVIRECQAMQIAILFPDVNESTAEFVATEKGIRFALTAIKGVGKGVVDAIVEEREKNGEYRSLYDFFLRLDFRKVGKKVVESLIEAGAFDSTGWTRAELLHNIDFIHKEALREKKESAKGVIDFLSQIDEDHENRFMKPPETCDPFPKQHTLRKEKELLGFYLTGHPMDEYFDMLPKLSCLPPGKLAEIQENSVCRVAFIIETVTSRISSRTHRKFAILIVSDGTERYELPVWPELFEEVSDLLVENQLIYAVLQVEKKEDQIRLQAKWLGDLTKVDEQMISTVDDAYNKAKMQSKLSEMREMRKTKQKQIPKTNQRLNLKIDIDQSSLSQVLEIKKIFRNFSGDIPVDLDFFSQNQAVGTICIESSWGIEYTKELRLQLSALESIENLSLREHE